MLSQIATKLTVSLAFLSAAMVFSPYPLLDQSRAPQSQSGIVHNVEHFVESSKHFVNDISKESRHTETSDLENRKEQVEKFRDQVASVVDTAEAAGIGKIQGLKETMEEVVEKITDKTGQGAHGVGGKVVEGAERMAESGEKASHAARDAVSSSTTSTKQAASSGMIESFLF
jgi:hypothetical protein